MMPLPVHRQLRTFDTYALFVLYAKYAFRNISCIALPQPHSIQNPASGSVVSASNIQ